MTRGEIFAVQVVRIAAGGAGIARLDGKSVFIDLTAPGDSLRCRIVKDHKNWAEAELLEILEPSPLRVSPPCPFYGSCGGCSIQHLSYESQISAKTSILTDAFTRIGGFTPPEIRVRASSPFEYRNRVQFHRTADNYFSFKERKSSRLVVLDDCLVADKRIRSALKERKFPSGKERFTVYSRGDTFLVEGGVERGKVIILNKQLSMDVGVFFQSNGAMQELLIKDLFELSAGADRNLPLVDIYCGVGTFAAILGEGLQGNQGFSEIELVEGNKTALTLAKENMPQGKKVSYYALSDTEWVKAQKEKKTFGFMVLDPPRDGLSGPLREFLADNGPDSLAYVSCDPATLARDSKRLIASGYMLKNLTMYDFYPQTAHIESLAFFSRKDRHHA